MALKGLSGLNSPSSNGVTTEQLLAAARAQGGAVAEIAEELSHPKRSILSTTGQKFGSAFSGFIDILGRPNQIVAGLIDPNVTVKEAMDQNINVSDVILGDRRERENTAWTGKVGSFMTRTAIDVLFDPLTYVTFGTSKGLMGISAATKFFSSKKAFEVVDEAGKTLAEKLGVRQIGDKVALSTKGEELADAYLIQQREGLRHTFLTNKKSTQVNAVKEVLKSQGINPTDEIVTQRLSDIATGVDDYLIKEVLDKRLSKSSAVQAVGRMIENNPALIETLVDKGGVKFFGKSILSGQRIRGTMGLIPGITLLDKYTQGPRDIMYSLFNRRGTVAGRLSDEVTAIDQKYRDLADSMNNDLLLNASHYFDNLGVTKQEAEFITAAIENKVRPNDARSREIWDALNGVMPEGNVIEPRVWQAMGFTEKQLNKNRKLLLEAGVTVSDLPNYFPHILVKEEVGRIGFRTPPKQTTARTRFAKNATLVDSEGNRSLVAFDATPDGAGIVDARVISDGEESRRKFRVLNADKELKRIEGLADKNRDKLTKEFDKIKTEISKSQEGLKTTIATNTFQEIEKRLKDVPDLGKKDKQAIVKAIEDIMDSGSVEKIVKKRMDRAYKNGVKLKGGQTIAKVDLDKLAQDLVLGKKSSKQVISDLNKVLAKSPRLKHTKVADQVGSKGVVDKELREIADNIIKETDTIRTNTISKGIDSKGVENLLTQVVARMSKNPTGIKRVIDSIIDNKQVADDITNELSDIARSLEIDTAEIAEQGGKFLDMDTGKVFEKHRITIEEAKEFGVSFEENALAALLDASNDAIKLSTSKHFIKEAGEKMGVARSHAPEGWRPIGITGLKHEGVDVSTFLTTKKGEELFFHPTTAKYIEDFSGSMGADEATNEMLKQYDKLQNLFKATVTSIWPAFHGRNAISNVLLSFLDIGRHALNPANHIKAGSMIKMNLDHGKIMKKLAAGTEGASKEYSDLMLKEIFTDNTGYKWSFGELRSVVKDNVVAFHPRNLGQIDQVQMGKETIEDTVNKLYPTSKKDVIKAKFTKVNPLSTDNIAIQTGFGIGQAIEDQARLVNFMANLKATGDPLAAAQRTKQFLFDYQNLSNFERTFLRRLVPFYTFSRKNLELQVKSLYKNPGLISAEVRAVQTIGDVLGAGGELTDEERASLPEWVQNGINSVLKREGNVVTVLNTIGSPIEQPFQQFEPNQALASISPIPRVPVEMMMGYSMFHGKPISEVTNAVAFKSAPGWIKDLIGFTEVNGTNKNTGETFTYYTALKPKNMHLISNLPPTTRVWSFLKDMQKEGVDQRVKAADLLFGFSPYKFDLEVESERRAKESQKELEHILDQVNAGYSFDRFILNKD